jgi:asparagine N-glycosylation enzyme membrane subunit Stt3
MSAKLFLTITAVLGILYGLAFVFFPSQIAPIYGVPADPHTVLETQFFGSALIWLGVVSWLAKDFRDWDAVRAVLIATVVGSIVGGGVNLLGTFQGLLNGMAWSSTMIYALLLVGALYCLSAGPEASGLTARPAR